MKKNKVTCILILFLLFGAFIASVNAENIESDINVNEEIKEKTISYQTHIQEIGWQNEKKENEISGTEGKSLRLEAIKINSSEEIQYQVHVQEIGWQGWKSNGELAGTEGKSLRLEAIRINLNNSDKYEIQYRVHIQEIGWQEWKSNGELAGTTGQSLRLEAIQIRMIEKEEKGFIKIQTPSNNAKVYNNQLIVSGYSLSNISSGIIIAKLKSETTEIDLTDKIARTKGNESYPEINNYGGKKYNINPGFNIDIDTSSLEGGNYSIILELYSESSKTIIASDKINIDLNKEIGIEYSAHIQDIGWQTTKKNEEVAGTEGKSLRIEGLKINLINCPEVAQVKYCTYIQDIGWQNYKLDNEVSGTIGESKPIYGIKIQLENMNEYSVEYRVHIQDYGWMEWKKDDEKAGKPGFEKRIEAIQIRIVKQESKNLTQIDNSKIKYMSYVQNNGWEEEYSREDGEISGTVGQDLRIKGLNINLTNSGNIKYNAHISNAGWLNDWTNEGIAIGDNNNNIEAIIIKLENMDNYSVAYRVHIQNVGWQEWKYDGEIAGTTGKSLGIEAIQIKIINKRKKVKMQGIDISCHQGNIDWSAVKSSGIDFAIIRCGYGKNIESQDDSKFAINVSECERLGIPYGVYLYSYAGDSAGATSEAEHALRLIRSGNANPTMGVWIDIEDADGYKVRNGISYYTSEIVANTFCSIIKNNGYRTGIYASLYWLEDYLDSNSLLSYEKWVAQWNSRCDYKKSYVMWQYSSMGSVNGILGNVDMDIYYQ